MINTEELTRTVQRYRERCRTANTKPTFKGMGNALGISGMTVSNVAHGRFNGRLYTEHPSATRIISNNDFEIIQNLFDERV